MKMKYQQGGVFNLPYIAHQTFLVPEKETATPTNKSKSNDSGIDMADVYKLLDDLKDVLPGDLAKVQSRLTNLFNSIELKTMHSSPNLSLGGTESIAYEYLQALSLVNKLKFAHAEYKTAQDQAIESGSIGEYAINSRGQVIVATEDGFDWKTPEEIFESDGAYTPITNQELLDYRSQGLGGLAFNSESIKTVANGISMSDVTKIISDTLTSLGTTSEQESGYAKVKAGQMIKGLEDFIAAKDKSGNYNASVEDLYKANLLNKDQLTQAKYALNYIYNTLPSNAISLLKMKSNGTTQGAKAMVDSLVYSKLSNTLELSGLSLESKQTKDTTNMSNPYLELIREEGGEERKSVIVPGGDNEGLYFTGTFYSKLPKINSEMSISELLSTGLQGITKQGTKGISFGDQILDPSQFSHVMFDNEGATVATLPIITDILGNIKVNMALIDDYTLVKEEMKKYKGLSKTDYDKKESELLHKYELDELIDPTTGLPDQTKTAQFLIIGAYTTDRIEFDKKSKYIKKIKNPSQELEERIIKGLSIDKDKSNYKIDVDDHWGFLEGSWDDIYRANVFIPLGQNPNAAINAWGDKRSEAAVSESEKQYQDWLKLTQMKPTYEIE